MSDNIREALEYAVELAQPAIYEHEGFRGFFLSDKKYHPIPLPSTQTITTETLGGLCDLIKAEAPARDLWYVQILSPTNVIVTTPPRSDLTREVPLASQAKLPKITFDNYMDVESFIIMLKARFLPNDDRDALIGLLGTITEEAVRTSNDDGVSQVVTARTGIATMGAATINPIRRLIPYRTFLEVKQPESDFLLRLGKGPVAALFEADGGAWKLDAVKAVADYISNELKDLDSVVVVR